MARTAKTGLDYFPLDVNFLQDRKIRRIMRKHGCGTGSALLALLSLIYRERGYYLHWNEDTCFDLSELADTDMDKMHAIVADAIRVDFFDERQFRENGILTSKAIQEQYITCTQKRKTVVIEESYALIEQSSVETENKETAEVENKCSANDSSACISVPQTCISGEEIPISAPEMQQRKEKEIERKLKEKQTTPYPLPKRRGFGRTE